MPQIFTFNTTNAVISPLTTQSLILGYVGVSEMDCVFVNKPFYVVFTMRDEFGNSILYTDEDAYVPVIEASLTDGLYYDNTKCLPYSHDGFGE